MLRCSSKPIKTKSSLNRRSSQSNRRSQVLLPQKIVLTQGSSVKQAKKQPSEKPTIKPSDSQRSNGQKPLEKPPLKYTTRNLPWIRWKCGFPISKKRQCKFTYQAPGQAKALAERSTDQ